ncbi:MAG: DUF1289 domain-containing protein [Xanthomonadales bacterium]|nr:DUF1289 domain-containing protein [Xanthomonadales bacterium]
MNTSQSAGPASPCINICRLDEQGFCIGCRRSLEEISAWVRLSAAEREAVLSACKTRELPADTSPRSR